MDAKTLADMQYHLAALDLSLRRLVGDEVAGGLDGRTAAYILEPLTEWADSHHRAFMARVWPGLAPDTMGAQEPEDKED